MMERELQELKDKCSLLSAKMETSLDGILVVDKNGKIVSCNNRFLELWGIPQSVPLSRPDDIYKILMDKILVTKPFIEKITYLFSHRQEKSKDDIALKDGRTFERYSAPVVDGESYHGRVWYFRDITERVRMEIAMIESERRFRELTELLPIGIFETDLAANITYCNQAGFELFGYCDDDLKSGINVSRLVAKEDALKTANSFKLLLQGKKLKDAGEYTGIKKDGTPVHILVNSSVVIKSGKPIGFRGFILDNSDKKRVDDSEYRYRIMMENASDMVTLLDANMRHEYINENELKLLGYQKNELIGKSALDLVHKDDLSSGIEKFMNGLMLGEGSGEFRIRHKDGHYIWFDMKGRTIIDKDGNKKGLLFSRDITEMKRMKDELLSINKDLEQRVEKRTRDLKETQEKLIRQEKFATIGKISSIISHELRNPMSTISNSVYYLNMKLDTTDEKVKKHVAMIQKEVERSQQIVNELLDFTRVTKLNLTKVNMIDVIKSALDRVTIPHEIVVETCFPETRSLVEMDSQKMERAFLNIITNAIQAMPKGGKLTMTVKEEQETVHASFKDTGIGISKENIPMLFEPLFTTKSVGIGLGLTMVKDVIDNHGGKIIVESEVGIGTTFEIVLPKSHHETVERDI
jgi:PAS domain S-box-containing protein